MEKEQTARSSRSMRAVDEGVPSELWRRVHPVSQVINIWKTLAAIVAVTLYNHSRETFTAVSTGFGGSRGILIAGGSVAGFMIILVLYFWLAWRATSFAVADTAVWYRSGIFAKTQRHARYERIQAVDIHHPLIGRIFGLGKIRIEVAGGGDSFFDIGYLKTEELENLRREILVQAAGLTRMSQTQTREAQSAEAVATSEHKVEQLPETSDIREGRSDSLGASEAPERIVYAVPSDRLIASIFLSGSIIFSLIVSVVVFAVFIGVFLRWGVESLGTIVGFGALALVGISFVWSRFSGEFNFTAAVSADGIRIRRGFLDTRAQTIPPKRVHAVQVHQPLFWRAKGWYRVRIIQAGYAGGTNNDSGSTMSGSDVLLPVGTQQDAVNALWLVIRDLGVEHPGALIEGMLHGSRGDGIFTEIPQRAKLFDPLAFKRRGYCLTDTSLVIRDGWLTRRVSIIPFERIQSLSLKQGPWERRRGLANVNAELVPGLVSTTCVHLDVNDAHTLLESLAVLARKRRDVEPPEKWMRRMESTPFGASQDTGS